VEPEHPCEADTPVTSRTLQEVGDTTLVASVVLMSLFCPPASRTSLSGQTLTKVQSLPSGHSVRRPCALYGAEQCPWPPCPSYQEHTCPTCNSQLLRPCQLRPGAGLPLVRTTETESHTPQGPCGHCGDLKMQCGKF
jgi:hypothetical protein